MKEVYVIILVASATLFSSTTAENKDDVGGPEGKLISTFQIVRFPNDACTGSNARNGTCYTSAECSDKGGTSSGSCADGFGVCCTFVVTSCDSASSENITYWDAPATVPSGECKLSINAINDNICQLRLDFLTFVITGPSTVSVSEVNLFGTALGGGGALGPNAAAVANQRVVGTAATSGSNWGTNCLSDSFSISTNNPANHPPVICGTNSGMHMYVDMDPDVGNVLSFIFLQVTGPTPDTLQDTKGVNPLANRDWDMTIMQYECGYVNSAPPGCTQYHFGFTSGWITSYNFVASTAGTRHLAYQNQKVCIRREKAICWAAFHHTVGTGAFRISGRADGTGDNDSATIAVAMPCGYTCELGTGVGANEDTCSYDCVIIPGLFAVAEFDDGIVVVAGTGIRAFTTAATNHSPAPLQIGGHDVFGGDVVVAGVGLRLGESTAMTMFTQHYPFQVTFKSDGFEGTGTDQEGANPVNSVGLKLNYDLITCTA